MPDDDTKPDTPSEAPESGQSEQPVSATAAAAHFVARGFPKAVTTQDGPP